MPEPFVAEGLPLNRSPWASPALSASKGSRALLSEAAYPLAADEREKELLEDQAQLKRED